MSNWFECVVQIESEHEQTGKTIKSKNTYLVDAMSFTEAEARMLEKLKELPRNTYAVKKLQPVKIEEIIDTNGGFDKWFKFKTVYVDTDEKGKVKKTSVISVVNANDTEHASKIIKDRMKDVQAQHYVAEIKEYDLFDYFPYGKLV
jgi:hypothetical protein